MKQRGFSLIELLVVIAIIGIIAAIAVPTYKKYIVRTKIASAIPSYNYVIQKIQNYQATHGILPTQPSDVSLDLLFPFGNNNVIQYVSFTGTTNTGPNQYMVFATIWSNFGQGNYNFAEDDNAGWIYSITYVKQICHAMQTICYYTYFLNGAPQSENLLDIPGCYNTFDGTYTTPVLEFQDTPNDQCN